MASGLHATALFRTPSPDPGSAIGYCSNHL